MVCKQMEQVIVGYLKQVGIRMSGYTRDSMVLDQDTHVKAKSSQYDST